MEDLYLPPRRKTLLQQQQQKLGIGGGGGRKRRKESDEESIDEDGSGGSGGDDRPKKRGRPPVKEKFPNFTDAELRRFIKSYKKFPAPLKRLEAIACDAELQEKPLAEIKKLAESLHERCVTFMQEHSKEIQNDMESKKRGARAGYSIKFGGVSFNAKTLMTCEDELQPLDIIMPNTMEERLKWTLEIKTRPANFDVEWTIDDDSKLLCGIYQYGIGSWEAMKMDPSLGISDKMLSNDNKKPQVKHIQSRAEYLLKIIRKSVESKKGLTKNRRQRQPKIKTKSKNIIENDAISSDDDKVKRKENTKPNNIDGGHLDCKLSHHTDEASINDGSITVANNTNATTIVTSKEHKKSKLSKHSNNNTNNEKSKKPKKKSDGPMHFTANNEPRALDVLGDLDPTVFNECKEKMRPVKKALKALDNPDQNLSNDEQLKHTRTCLLDIGKQIDICLSAYKEPEIKEWRSNLWYFVSKFTEYDARKLFKLYKHSLKTNNDEQQQQPQHHSKSKNKQSPVKMVVDGGSGARSGPIRIGSDGKNEMIEKKILDKNMNNLDSNRERRERKEKKRHKEKKDRRDRVEQQHELHHQQHQQHQSPFKHNSNNHITQYNNSSININDNNDSVINAKRRLEEGECEPDVREYKRLHDNR